MPADELFDPFDPETQENPFPIYKVLRDSYPAYRNRSGDLWALPRYDDAQAAARDWKTFSSASGVDLDHTSDMVVGTGDFIAMDPPRHDVLRRIVRARFTPPAVRTLEPLVRTVARRVIQDVAGRGSFDIVSDYALPLTLSVLSHVLGVPSRDTDQVAAWVHAAFEREHGSTEVPAAAIHGATCMKDYLNVLIAQRRSDHERADDLLGDIICATHTRGCSDAEAIGLAFLVFGAGVGTTEGLISTAVSVLAEHPIQRKELASRLSMMPRQWRSCCGMTRPSAISPRVTTRPVSIHGVEIPAGERVALLFASANRDERRFARPDELDFSRTFKRHMAFGNGIHFCLGAHLARLQARVAREELLTVLPDYRLGAPVERTAQRE